jgi:hypothetical protein
MFFFVFCEFLLNEQSEVKFFRLKRSALKRGIQRCRIHCHIMFNKGAMAVYSYLFNEFVCNFGFFWHEWTSLKLE